MTDFEQIPVERAGKLESEGFEKCAVLWADCTQLAEAPDTDREKDIRIYKGMKPEPEHVGFDRLVFFFLRVHATNQDVVPIVPLRTY